MAASAPGLQVIEPGLLTTVQDLGRRGFEHLGVPRSGAADARSLALANALIGNDEGDAALEATLLGPTLRATRQITIGLAGADLAPVAQPGHRRLAVGQAHRLEPGEVLECTEAGDEDRGCRLYIAVGGGIDVPTVLGSRSTSLIGSFGGFEGRPLRTRDLIDARAASAAGGGPPDGRPDRRPGAVAQGSAASDTPMLVLAGPAAAEPGGAERLARFLDVVWTVGIQSDRRGLRLEVGPRSDVELGRLAVAGDRSSAGVAPGAIQLTPSGQPIVLMPDAGTTGGYPVIAVVASADVWRLGQLAPGAPARFRLAR
ncbi:MAG TPA: biotin-dependent carboxyltransferase family protein [Candidatus Limnocylindrales bacterium]|nr:biotin-dependent carboxyltransferase family protein [Candidatus Limnocylindrales bacterium]